MFKWLKKNKKMEIEDEIHSVLCNMSTYAPDSEEYSIMSKNLEILAKAKSYQKDRRISKDVVLQVVGALAGTVLVLYFEKANVITSKAFGSVFKGRV